MDIERLHKIGDSFVSLVENQLECLECVNTCEMREVIDIIKDISEAIYYTSKAHD